MLLCFSYHGTSHFGRTIIPEPPLLCPHPFMYFCGHPVESAQFFEMSLIEILTILALLFLAASFWWYAKIPSNLPPGPLGLPFIGSTLDTWRVKTWFNTLHAWSTRYGSVYKLYIGNQLVVVLGDWNAIQEALVKQADAYAGRPIFRVLMPKELEGLGLANSEGELWKTQRRFALSTFRDFGFGRPIIEPRIKDEAEHLLEAIGSMGGNAFDPTTLLGNAVSNIICQLVFGKRFQYDDRKFHQLLRMLRSRLSETKFTFMTPIVLSETVAKLIAPLPPIEHLRKTAMDLVNFIREQAKEATANFQPDTDDPLNYVQAFYKAKTERKDDWTFTDQQLLASVANLFAAGTETTATTIRWAIFLSAQYPHFQERVYEEIKETTGGQSLLSYADRTRLPFVEATIMETQRFANLLPVGLFRRTVAPSKLRGYDIPVGAVVAPLLGAVLNDPKVYPNPEMFDPTRFLNGDKQTGDVFSHLIPFSAGKRICLGESLARMELFIFFTALMSRYKFYFPPNEPKPSLAAPIALIRTPPPYKICVKARLD